MLLNRIIKIMVLLFIITSFQGVTPSILFYKYFYCDASEKNRNTNSNIDLDLAVTSDTSGGDDSCHKDSFSADEKRKTRKVQLKRVVERFHSIYQFFIATNSRSMDSDIQILNSDDIIPEFETGHFKLYKDDPFFQDMHVIWTTVCGLGLAFICNASENRLQAEITLKVLVRELHVLCKSILQPNDILNKPDRVGTLLSKFVPDGNLLFMNHRTIRQFEREAEAHLKAAAN